MNTRPFPLYRPKIISSIKSKYLLTVVIVVREVKNEENNTYNWNNLTTCDDFSYRCNCSYIQL